MPGIVESQMLPLLGKPAPPTPHLQPLGFAEAPPLLAVGRVASLLLRRRLQRFRPTSCRRRLLQAHGRWLLPHLRLLPILLALCLHGLHCGLLPLLLLLLLPLLLLLLFLLHERRRHVVLLRLRGRQRWPRLTPQEAVERALLDARPGRRYRPRRWPPLPLRWPGSLLLLR